MAEPLKNQYGLEVPRKIAAQIVAVDSSFEVDAFMKKVSDGYEDLELLPRGQHIAEVLKEFLPADYPTAIDILIRSLGPKLEHVESFGMEPFHYMPHACFIREYGVEHFEESMTAQYEVTQRFTAEFSIRAYLERYPEQTLQRLEEWLTDPSEHVRRLVSEGTRPRLPWASRLKAFQKDPAPILPLLEKLRDDSSLYVRRSVANNLNDISKDHPDLVVDITKKWSQGASPEREWLIKHALRGLVQAGNEGALKVLGYEGDDGLEVLRTDINPDQATIGGSVTLAVTLKNISKQLRRVMVDAKVHYVKANGTASPKVFKLKPVELAPAEELLIKKKISLKEMTTRKHYPGEHRVELMLNGQIHPFGSFDLKK